MGTEIRVEVMLLTFGKPEDFSDDQESKLSVPSGVVAPRFPVSLGNLCLWIKIVGVKGPKPALLGLRLMYMPDADPSIRQIGATLAVHLNPCATIHTPRMTVLGGLQLWPLPGAGTYRYELIDPEEPEIPRGQTTFLAKLRGDRDGSGR